MTLKCALRWGCLLTQFPLEGYWRASDLHFLDLFQIFFFFWRNTLLRTTFWLLSWSNLIMVISKGIGLARVIDVLMLKNHVTDRSICSPRQNSLGTWFAKDEEWKDNEKDFEENCFQTTWWAWGHKHSSRTWYRWSAYFPCRWLIHFNHNCSRATT